VQQIAVTKEGEESEKVSQISRLSPEEMDEIVSQSPKSEVDVCAENAPPA
jgi:hypothetical protein